MNYRQIFAKKKSFEKQLFEMCRSGKLNNESGIYWFTRHENGFNYAYIGQALHILDRCVSHMQGYKQHIDLSLKKHGLWSEEKQSGWQLYFRNFPAEQLNGMEQYYIRYFADNGYQLLNKTSGSQGTEKFAIVDNQRKGYLQGKNDGKIAILKQIKVYFDKYLDFVIKGKPNKIKERKFEEFKNLLEEQNNE